MYVVLTTFTFKCTYFLYYVCLCTRGLWPVTYFNSFAAKLNFDVCSYIRWIEYNTIHANAELNLNIFENKYSKDHNFKTNQDFSFKFGPNVIYILQNVLITLTLAIIHQVHVLSHLTFEIFKIFEQIWIFFFFTK